MDRINNKSIRITSAGEGSKDIFDLPEGHKERFVAKLSSRKRTGLVPILSTISVAAVLAMALLLHTQSLKQNINDNDYFAGVTRTPEAVYNSYISQVLQVQKALENLGLSDYWKDTLEQIYLENVPLMESLPEELSSEDAFQIVSNHYSTLLSDIYDFQRVVIDNK